MGYSFISGSFHFTPLVTLEVFSEIISHHVCESLLQSLALKPLYKNVHHSKGHFTFDKTFSAVHFCLIVSILEKQKGIFESDP